MRMVLTTPRLKLSPISDSHLQDFLRVAGSRVIADTTISIPHPLTEVKAREWIAKAVAENQSGNAAHFAINISPDEALAGYVALKDIGRVHSQAELSFWIGEPHARKGYTTEAAAAAVAFAFGDLHLNRLYAHHMARNPASGRVLAKLNFRQEGYLRQRVRKWGLYEDVLLWARLAGD